MTISDETTFRHSELAALNEQVENFLRGLSDSVVVSIRRQIYSEMHVAYVKFTYEMNVRIATVVGGSH